MHKHPSLLLVHVLIPTLTLLVLLTFPCIAVHPSLGHESNVVCRGHRCIGIGSARAWRLVLVCLCVRVCLYPLARAIARPYRSTDAYPYGRPYSRPHGGCVP
jgi:hypothetical protein